MKGRFFAKLKQSISALLALVMALALVPMSALAGGSWSITDEDDKTVEEIAADAEGKAKFKVTAPDADTKNYYIYDKLDDDTDQYYVLATVEDGKITLVNDEDAEDLKSTANVSSIELDSDGLFTATLMEKEKDATLAVGLDSSKLDFTIKAYEEVAAPKVTFDLTGAEGVTVTNVENATKATSETEDETEDIYTVTDKAQSVTFKLTVAESVEKAYVLTVKVGSDPEAAEALEVGTNGVYTLEKSTADVQVTVTLTYLPEVEEDKDAGVENATKAEVSEDQVDGLTALITGDAEVEGTENNKSVTVETDDAGDNKTLVFDGTAGDTNTTNNGHKVVLPTELTKALATGETQANVKVNSGVGSVTVPSDALADKTESVTISVVKKTIDQDAAEALNFKDNKGEALSASLKDKLTAALTNASGLSVGTKVGTKDTSLATDKTPVGITFNIGTSNRGASFYILCTSGVNVTSFGKQTVNEEGFITIYTKHLSDFVPVEATDDVEEALAALAEDDASVVETESNNIELTYTAQKNLTGDDAKKYYGGKLEISGLTAGKLYVVTFDYGLIANDKVPRAVVVVEADENGEATLSCQSSMKVVVLETGDDNNVNAEELSAVFYDPDNENQGVLVTNSDYITQN